MDRDLNSKFKTRTALDIIHIMRYHDKYAFWWLTEW